MNRFLKNYINVSVVYAYSAPETILQDKYSDSRIVDLFIEYYLLEQAFGASILSGICQNKRYTYCREMHSDLKHIGTGYS